MADLGAYQPYETLDKSTMTRWQLAHIELAHPSERKEIANNVCQLTGENVYVILIKFEILDSDSAGQHLRFGLQCEFGLL